MTLFSSKFEKTTCFSLWDGNIPIPLFRPYREGQGWIQIYFGLVSFFLTYFENYGEASDGRLGVLFYVYFFLLIENVIFFDEKRVLVHPSWGKIKQLFRGVLLLLRRFKNCFRRVQKSARILGGFVFRLFWQLFSNLPLKKPRGLILAKFPMGCFLLFFGIKSNFAAILEEKNKS